VGKQPIAAPPRQQPFAERPTLSELERLPELPDEKQRLAAVERVEAVNLATFPQLASMAASPITADSAAPSRSPVAARCRSSPIRLQEYRRRASGPSQGSGPMNRRG
jgi:hypothetical protein